MSMPRAALRSPIDKDPPRPPDSVRRTSSVDIVRDGSVTRLLGQARDLYTAPSGEPAALDLASVDAVILDDRTLGALTTTPRLADLGQLVGQPIGRGFRARLGEVLSGSLGAESVLALLLDDLPVASLIGGYAQLHSGELQVGPGAGPGTDTCSGWRAGGVMMSLIGTGAGQPIARGPAEPSPAGTTDPLSCHPLEPLAPGAMRRRRRLEISGGNPLTVEAWFRDTHAGPSGVATIVHEYTVHAAVDLASMTLVRCDAIPQVLPWVECPVAGASAWGLVGTPVHEIRQRVRATFHGVHTCTHLNDLLRSLGDVPVLMNLRR